MGVANAGQQPMTEIQPGRIPAPQGTGAGQGSPSGQPSASTGNLATVPVTINGASSQIATDMARVDYADTAGGSADNPNVLGFSGQEQTSAAWQSPAGHVIGDHHPKAGG